MITASAPRAALTASAKPDVSVPSTGAPAAYTTFVWLLAHAPISLVSTHAYVNPVVAVLLGWVWLSEPITWPVVVGGAVVLVAVGLVMAERRRSRDESRDDPREEPPIS